MPMLENPMEEKFAQLYFETGNKSKAAMDAGFTNTPGSAGTYGYRLSKKVHIIQRIEELKAESAFRVGITKDRVLEELARIAFADMKDFLKFRTAVKQVGVDDGEPVFDYAQIIDMKDSDEVDGRVIQSVSVDSKGTFKFTLHPKQAALEKLGQHLGMFKDAAELDVNVMVSFSGDEAIPD